MQGRTTLIALLAGMALAIFIYTFRAMTNDPQDFVTVFLNDIRALNWNGQFNLDFACYLLLSGLWIMWRNKYNLVSILASIAAMVLGFVFFGPYLIYLIVKSNGDMKRVLLGNTA